MSAKTNYFKIGIFVMTAAAMGVIAIIALGAGALFEEETLLMETCFDETVQGLEVGSPIKRRGVRIGRVEEITFANKVYAMKANLTDPTSNSQFVIVRASIEPEVFGRFEELESVKRVVDKLVTDGLRVQLASQGLTGLVYLELDYVDPRRNPPMEIKWKPTALYVPSIPSTLTMVTESIQEMFKRVEEVEFEQMSGKLNDLLGNLNQTVTDAQISTLSQQTISLLEEVRATNQSIREMIEDENTRAMMSDASSAMESFRMIAENAKVNGPQIMDDLAEVASKAKDLSVELDKMIRSDEIQGTITNVAKITEDMPEVLDSFKQTLDRVEMLVVSQQQNMTVLIENMTAVSSNLREITANAKKYPSQAVFGEPPPPVDPGRRK